MVMVCIEMVQRMVKELVMGKEMLKVTDSDRSGDLRKMTVVCMCQFVKKEECVVRNSLFILFYRCFDYLCHLFISP